MAIFSQSFRKFVYVCLTLGFAALLAAQLYRSTLTRPPVTADLQAPPEVKQVLQNSCYSCHSNQPKLSWFDQPAPAYWLVVHDINQARARLNFSEIAKLPAAQQRAMLFEAVNQVQLGAMPLPQYVLAHRGARLNQQQINILRDYLEHPPTAPAPAAPDTADAQYNTWIASANTTAAVKPDFNGPAFQPDYKNWTPISSTNRWDNHTLRQVLANDIAIRALAAGNINPWPNGAAFAKVAWFQRDDGHGNITTGAFQQVEFMLRDSRAYASTAGWGFARWRGADLQPYGKDAAFASECVSCHTPMRRNDYVYTLPISAHPPTAEPRIVPASLLERFVQTPDSIQRTLTAYNDSARPTGPLPTQPLAGKVITSWVTNTPGQSGTQSGTMTTLLGNDVAVNFARTHAQTTAQPAAYPAGSTLTAITWAQQEDPRWFGGRIPATPQSVEYVTITTTGAAYQRFQGQSLQLVAPTTTSDPRASFLLSQRAAVMP